ncbi:radical SAM protein [Desulfotignum phosphitoxidans]|uniref:L-lysine 2,3-aminomutase KamA n=1 Tax=Desulfotignum phosphitoxidans DSM 13687 TaxID=1286635 RepID=S0FUB1_9BACT|nr:radical SAM protein [Desulfotignum phosphitoxidans]EMS78280.1 L-lysine 2,3-aminomutase KamA [Desulfotignum phosphitoxidans DSM 13687]
MKTDRNISDTTLDIRFEYSGEQKSVTLSQLEEGARTFLEIYGNAQFCGKEFADIIQQGNGQSKWENLLAATGFEGYPKDFFKTVLSAIAGGEGQTLALNGVTLPHILLVAFLEQVIPGHGYVSVRSTEQLISLTNHNIPETDRDDIQKVIEKYPVRLSRHTIRQMMVSRDVAYQYLPFVEELDNIGHTNTWIGQFHDGLLEQMYQNRVIFLLNMSCPVYCRFCFRKHKDSRNEKNPTPKAVMKAVDHVRSSPSIKEIVITGGDPFLNRKNMEAAIDGLKEVDHVQTLRLATRSIAYYPDLFLEKEAEYLKYIKQKSLELNRIGKRIEVATHFIHPDEVSPESLDIISDLVKHGIAVYIQTPFLSDCNDTGPELVRLFSLLRGAGAELHYIYIPCSPIHGNSIYWKPLSDGIDIALHLRAHLSDRVIPRICTATPIGKMDWFSSGWAVEKVADQDYFVWIRTPYTPEYFKAFAPLANSLTNIRVNAEGTIDIQYMAKIGNDDYLVGNRPEKTAPVNPEALPEEVARLRTALTETDQTAGSVVDTGVDGISRLHETRVNIHPRAGEAEFAYIAKDPRITDVRVTGEALDHLYEIQRIAQRLASIPHVNALRVCSMKLATDPRAFTRARINFLGEVNALSVVTPLRLEIETWFVLVSDLTPDHTVITRRLNSKGITIYANVPLLGGVNDNDTRIHDLAYTLRSTGIEFHHLYVAGLPVQISWNAAHPIDSYDVVDIATKVRREGSGREIPRYIIATPLGEVDYGLTSTMIRKGDAVDVELRCYDETYYTSLAPEFQFPEGTAISETGHPVVPMPGLIKTNDFVVS